MSSKVNVLGSLFGLEWFKRNFFKEIIDKTGKEMVSKNIFYSLKTSNYMDTESKNQ